MSFAYTVSYIIFIIMIYQSLQMFYPRHQPSVQQMFCRLVLLTVRLQEPRTATSLVLLPWRMVDASTKLHSGTYEHTHTLYLHTDLHIHTPTHMHTYTHLGSCMRSSGNLSCFLSLTVCPSLHIPDLSVTASRFILIGSCPLAGVSAWICLSLSSYTTRTSSVGGPSLAMIPAPSNDNASCVCTCHGVNELCVCTCHGVSCVC